MGTTSRIAGRAPERELLGRRLDELLAGRGGLVLLHGEPGIGKTRLCEDLADRAALRGASVAWGRAWEAGGAPAFWPWIQALRAVRALDTDPQVPPAVARILPELGGGAQDGPIAPGPERLLTLDGVVRWLARAAERTPLVILLEDLHAADEASLELAILVARERAGSVLLVGTYRDLDARRRPELDALLSRLAREGDSLALRGLSRSELAELVGEDAGRLLDVTGGNPLFVTELMHAGAGASPSGSVRAAIRAHLEILSASCLPCVEAAAAIGREVTASLVAEVCGLTAAETVSLLARAAAAGILKETAPSRFTFAHGLLRDTLHGDMAAERRAELHLAIARALQARAGAEGGASSEIARHLLAAGPQHAAEAAAAARRAATEASGRIAFAQAADELERALAALDAVAAEDRTEILLELIEASARAARWERALELSRRVAEKARTSGDPVLLARAALELGADFRPGRVVPPLVSLLEEALRLLPDEPGALRARLMARLAAARQPASDPRREVELARAAIRMAREHASELDLLYTLHTGMSAMMDYAPPPERLALNREAAEIADRRGQSAVLLRAMLRIVWDLASAGELARAAEAMRAYEGMAARFATPAVRWPVPLFGALLAMVQGRFEDRDRLEAEARDLMERADDEGGRYALGLHSIVALRAREATLEIVARGPEIIASCSHHPLFGPACAAMIALRSGDHAAARDHLALLSCDALRGSWDTMLGAIATEVAVAVGDRPRLEALRDLLEPLAGEMCSWEAWFSVDGPVSRRLLELAIGLGNRRDAERWFEAAAAWSRREGARPTLAAVQATFAEGLAAWGEKARARDLAAEALAAAEALGLRETAARARRVLDGAPDRPGGIALEREGETWLVRAGGTELRLRDARGLHMLASLLADPGRELHALDLDGAQGPVDGGDAGEVLDETAKARYRARVRALAEEIEEAEERGDVDRAERAREEQEAIARELSRATGLGGRSRRAGAAAERARINVQRRIADAIRRIAEQDAGLGAHLERAVRTGTYCSYDPRRAER